MKFIVYSDIHHDKLSSRCLSINDTVNIENNVHKYARENQAEFVIFCGDRFFLRDPIDEVKTKADWTLLNNMMYANYKQYHLIGNHDWVNKSMRWHTSESLRVCNNIVIMDSPQTYAVNNSILIHALPSGYNFNIDNYNINKNFFNIFVFHELVIGCYLDSTGKYTSTNGIKLEDIDRPEFDFVIAGDNHIPQQFAFQFTKGGYAGSVCQRTKNDIDSSRGWLDIDVEYNNEYNIKTKFITTREFFKRVSINVDENTSFSKIIDVVDGIEDVLLEIELIGDKEHVDNLANNEKWKNLEFWGTIRNLDIVRNYNVEKTEVMVDMSKSHSINDDLDIYIDSGFVNLGNISKDQLMSKLTSYMEVIK